MAIFVDEAARSEFVSWIDERIDSVLAGRKRKAKTWQKWRRQREARPEHEVKNYPWPKASNLCVPLSNINAQTIYGQLQGAITTREPFWTCHPVKREDKTEVERMRVLTRYLDILAQSPFDLNLEEKLHTILYESGSMGTCWIKVFWDETHWSFIRDGAVVDSFLHYGPSIVPVPLEDVLYEEGLQDIASTTWVAQHFVLPLYEIEDAFQRGEIVNAEDVIAHEVEVTEEWKRDQLKRMGVVPMVQTDLRDLYLVYWKGDTNGDGKSEECVALIHRPTKSVLQEYYNDVGVRPLVAAKYALRPFFVEGIGTCWLSEGMQDEVDTLHNMRINNVHISTLNMFSAKRTSGIRPGETLFPGKIFFLDSPDSIKPLKHGETLPSSRQDEMLAREYSQRATSASDIMQGFADTTVRTGETFGGQTQRMQQGTRMIHGIIRSLVTTFSQVGMHVLFQLVANREAVIARETQIGRLTEEEITALDGALNIPVEDIPTRIRFSVRTTDIEETVQQKRQDLLFRVQLQNMFYDRLMPLVLQMENPQLPPSAKIFMGQMYTATCRTLEKVLTFFDEYETDRYVPEYKKFELFNEVMQVMQDARFEQLLGQMMGGGGNAPRQSAVRRIAPGGGAPRGAAFPAGVAQATAGLGPGASPVPGMAGPGMAGVETTP